MIETKEDYKLYLEADRIALNRKAKRPGLFGDEIWKFQRLLRKAEYLNNCKSGLLWKLRLLVVRFRLKRLSLRLNFSIPLNVFGPGLSIAHIGTIVVNHASKVGANCRIHVCVNIGSQGGSKKAPQIGNNVYIGPGAKIMGDIRIADNIAIGANAVVNKSFDEPNITIAGVPARKISDKGSDAHLVKAVKNQ